MKTPLLAVIVPSHPALTILSETLESLVRQQTEARFRYEVVVVDSGDDAVRDLVAEMAETTSVPLRYVRHDLDRETAAWNRGVEHTAAPWLTLFGRQQVADPRWLLELFLVAQAMSAPIVGGPSQLDLTDHELACLGVVCRKSLQELRPYSHVRPYDANQRPVAGHCLIARGVFDAVGPFDESLATAESQTDFLEQARRHGYTPWYAPRSIVRRCVGLERLTPAHFRREFLYGGVTNAANNARDKLRLAAACAARIARTAFVDLPLLAWSWLRRDPGEMLGRRTSLWSCEGFVRKTAAIFAPRLFAQPRFFAQWRSNAESRRERTVEQVRS